MRCRWKWKWRRDGDGDGDEYGDQLVPVEREWKGTDWLSNEWMEPQIGLIVAE
jgi:hypothetical protein